MNGGILDDIMIHMVENDMALSQKVRDIINCATCSTYTGSVEVSVVDDCIDNIFTVRLGLNCEEAPLVFGYQGTQESFLKYLEKEIRRKRLQLVKYTKATLINYDEAPQLYPIIEI